MSKGLPTQVVGRRMSPSGLCVGVRPGRSGTPASERPRQLLGTRRHWGCRRFTPQGAPFCLGGRGRRCGVMQPPTPTSGAALVTLTAAVCLLICLALWTVTSAGAASALCLPGFAAWSQPPRFPGRWFSVSHTVHGRPLVRPPGQEEEPCGRVGGCVSQFTPPPPFQRCDIAQLTPSVPQSVR
ncbi:hypothetical protein HJG60_012145 [Phyllostomus discolor]|uniref:Uncharacterized protein n=1 Tax=Phyllostomus discolor TaxID=89673 RepID=A0A833ZEX1_9CHIR|nr:hypothetical protein HJG60_012145 [Phyllostomus discolor]